MEMRIYELEIKIWDAEYGICEDTTLFRSIKGVESAIAHHINEVGSDNVLAQFWTLASDNDTDEFFRISDKPDGAHVGTRFINEAKRAAEQANRHLQFLLNSVKK